MYEAYDHLSAGEKACYHQLLSDLKRYSLTVKLEGIDPDTVPKALRALLHDHPEFFWLTGAADYTTTLVNRAVRDITVKMKLAPGLRLGDVPSMAQRLERTIDSIAKQAGRLSSAYEKVKAVHDYIIDTTDYVEANYQSYTPYGCLVNHRAVCSGYAKAFLLIMRRLGFVCGFVSGFGRKNGASHAWNYIRLENQYYFVDVTWDDPLSDVAGPAYDNKTWEYFCLTTEELLKTHKLSNEYPVPVCNGTKYNYYRYNGAYLQRYAFSAVLPIAAAQLRRNKQFSIKFGSVSEASRALTDLINNRRVFDIPGIQGSIRYSLSESKQILTVSPK